MIVLDDLQNKVLEEIRGHHRQKKKNVLLQAQTGFGKTVVGGAMMGGVFNKGNDGWFCVHRQELIEQTAKTFAKFEFPFGINGNTNDLLQIWSIPSLTNRLSDLTPPKSIKFDETHHIDAPTWARIFNWSPETYHTGLSATPILPNGNGLGKYYSEIVRGPTVPELIASGRLTAVDYYGPYIPDLDSVRLTGSGEYNKDDIDKIMAGKAVVGNVVNAWRKYAAGKLTIGFAPTVKTSKMYARAFSEAGIPAAHLDGDTPKEERKEIIQAFARREILVLFNVDLFGEGFDISAIADTDVAIECVIMARPTKSLRIAKQQAGRCMRKKPDGSNGVIIDAAGNWTRHGLPEDIIFYSLDAKPVRQSSGGTTVAITQCEMCYGIFRPAPVCPHCGHSREIEERALVFMDGELKRIQREHKQFEIEQKKRDRERLVAERAAKKAEEERIKKQKKKELRDARTLSELIAFGKKYNYDNPLAWAQRYLRMRHDYKNKYRRR